MTTLATARLGRVAVAAALVATLLVACTTNANPKPAGGAGAIAGCPTAAPPKAAAGTSSTATIETPQGKIVIKLEADLGPAAVGNFVALAKCGYYDGVVFQRLVPGFVIQGGDGQYGRKASLNKQRVGGGGPGYEFKDDPVTTAYTRSTLAMANAGPDTNGSQFFIVLDDNTGLEPKYSILGHVTAGMDVVDAIAAMPTSGDSALDPVPMTKITITTP